MGLTPTCSKYRVCTKRRPYQTPCLTTDRIGKSSRYQGIERDRTLVSWGIFSSSASPHGEKSGRTSMEYLQQTPVEVVYNKESFMHMRIQSYEDLEKDNCPAVVHTIFTNLKYCSVLYILYPWVLYVRLFLHLIHEY